MTLSDLIDAAAEDLAVCLSCEEVQEPVALPDEGCSVCSSHNVFSASWLLKAAEFLGRLEEGESDA